MGSAATVFEKEPSAMCWRQRPLPLISAAETAPLENPDRAEA